MKTQTILVLSTLLIMLVALTACVPATYACSRPYAHHGAIAWTHQSQFAGCTLPTRRDIMLTKGWRQFCSRRALEVDKLAPILNGTAQFSTASADELILARSEGKPLRGNRHDLPAQPRSFSSPWQIKILPDQRISLGRRSASRPTYLLSLRAMMDMSGIAPDQYTVVTLPSDLSEVRQRGSSRFGGYLPSDSW